MAANPWNYTADKRILDRIKDSRVDGYVSANLNFTYQWTKSNYIGIIKGNYIDLYVELWTSVDGGAGSGYYYHGATILGKRDTKDGNPVFWAYPIEPFGIKSRGEAFKTAATIYAERSSGLSPKTIDTYASSMHEQTLEAKLNIQRIRQISGRPLPLSMEDTIRIKNQLLKQGYSNLEADAYVRATTDNERSFISQVSKRNQQARQNPLGVTGQTGSGGSGGSGGRGKPANGSNSAALMEPVSLPQVETRLVVRMPTGYLPPSNLQSITKPALYQTFLDEEGNTQDLKYEFDYVPSNIRYSELGSEWVEIPRAENYAFVDWARYKLMKVSMSWVIAYDRVEPGGATVHDGIFRSVDSSINLLRTMARNKYPVSIVNMDDLLSVQLRRSETTGGVRGMQFVITDLNITSARRTTDPSTGRSTSPSRIAVAQCEMTLQEIPIESVQIATLPSIGIPTVFPKNPRQGTLPSLPDPGFVRLAPDRNTSGLSGIGAEREGPP